MALKIAVMGSGGVGGFFGARLAQSGSDVTFVARGSHLAAIRAEGLRVDSKTSATHIHPARCVENAADAGAVDAVLFCVKMADTESAARQILPLVARGATVFTFQNGVESADKVGAIVGARHVVAGTAQIAAVISEPGVIKHTGTMARMVFGLDEVRHARAVLRHDHGDTRPDRPRAHRSAGAPTAGGGGARGGRGRRQARPARRGR